jgi:hypothetical protein
MIWSMLTLPGSPCSPDLAQNPGLKLLEFFMALVESFNKGRMVSALDVSMNVQKSITLVSSSPVSTAWMEMWLKQWDI